MVTIDLAPGQHIIKMSLAGHEMLDATINVSSTGAVTCVSIVGGTCYRQYGPSIMISGNTVTGYLKESPTAPITSFNVWVVSKNGANGIKGNLLAVGEIIDGYLKIKDLGFTVSLSNVGSVIDYYLGLVI